MSRADTIYTTSPGDASEPTHATHRRGISPKKQREIRTVVLREHLSHLEAASVILAHSIERQKVLLQELQALEGGWNWGELPVSNLLIQCGLRDLKVALVPREG